MEAGDPWSTPQVQAALQKCPGAIRTLTIGEVPVVVLVWKVYASWSYGIQTMPTRGSIGAEIGERKRYNEK